MDCNDGNVEGFVGYKYPTYACCYISFDLMTKYDKVKVQITASMICFFRLLSFHDIDISSFSFSL
ncbi:hypothetical protein NMB1329 [Neisseria meningitidis MC58]|uniref:Uncharacterized protein n=1 Tax=Neisseria meningitidis serogroup B (strain ATCC BAA-335 / MC58) TaxID=122586 RepID=Q9JZ23_NEIMB|nr:hypothetical protein NMB1329 [Neisseria meningitidis MC58]